jgi:hypothetical protein
MEDTMKRQRRDWKAIARDQAASGKSVNEYCKGMGIHPSTFYKGRKVQQRRELVEIAAPTMREIPPIILKTQRCSLVIRRGFDPESLRSILQVIGGVE